MSWTSLENKYLTEYLITPKYLIEIMSRSNCEWIDFDHITNIFNNKEWFTDFKDYDENEKN